MAILRPKLFFTKIIFSSLEIIFEIFHFTKPAIAGLRKI